MQFDNITCPHCGLLCDDISVQTDNLSVQVIHPKHTFCSSAFDDASLTEDSLPSAKVDGNNVSLDQALDKTREILRNSSLPLISGLITDVQACRNAMALTEKLGGVIDHANGSAMRHGSAVMQRNGEVRTTLAEVRNRADCVVIFGNSIFDKFPRLASRILSPKKSLGSEQTKAKKIFVLELAKDEQSKPTIDADNITRLALDFPLLESLVYRLQEVVTNPNDCFTDCDGSTEKLLALKQTILDSQYTTFIWTGGEFNQESAEQTVQAIYESIKILMQQVRVVGLPLGGSKAEVTANQVATWQTGVPLPVSYTSGVPIHNPVLFGGKSMLKNKEADCLLWISTYRSSDTPPETDAPTIVIGHPKMDCPQANVYIPTGVPGIDHKGLACRTDNVATLPLRSVRTSNLLSADAILRKIIQSIENHGN